MAPPIGKYLNATDQAHLHGRYGRAGELLLPERSVARRHGRDQKSSSVDRWNLTWQIATRWRAKIRGPAVNANI